MKKLLLTLGTTVAIVSPAASVIACGKEEEWVRTYPESTLSWDKMEKNIEKYLDVEGKKLLWDGIIEDGYTEIEIWDSDYWSRDWLSNTDMVIPLEITNLNQTFQSQTINNPVRLHKKLMENAFNNRLHTSTFANAHLKKGIILDNDVEYIPASFLYRATVDWESYEDIALLPNSLKVIGEKSFFEMETDVFDPHDLGLGPIGDNLVNLTKIGLGAFYSKFVAEDVVTMPPNYDFNLNYSDDGYGLPFSVSPRSDGFYTPKMICYFSDTELTSTQKGNFIYKYDKVEWKRLDRRPEHN